MKTNRLTSKLLSLFLSFLLLTQASLGAANGEISAPSAPEDKQNQLPIIDQITVPHHLGEIKSRYARLKSDPTIIHIQDAHANLSAQKSIREILHHLNRSYNVDLVLFEGAFGELAPSKMDYFESADDNQKTAELFEKEALISGGERFLLDKHWGKQSAIGLGVENPMLYKKNIRQFREVLAAKSEISAWLENEKINLTTEASKVFPKDLRDFFRQWSLYQDNHNDMLRHFETLSNYSLKHLSIDFRRPDSQIDWPQLARFHRLKDFENQTDTKALELETNQLTGWIQKNESLNRCAENFKSAFLSLDDPGKTQALDLRQTAEQFLRNAKPFNFSFAAYPELSKSISRKILQSELNAESLFAEMGRLTEKIFGILAKTEEEKRAVERYENYLLLRKLFALELTREEYQKLIKSKINFQGNVSLYQKALGFYETAIARETHLFSRTREVMRERRRSAAVLITGGFHSQGLSERFTSNQFSYLDISPRISDLKTSNNYASLMTLGASPRAAADHPHWLDAALQTYLPDEAAHMNRIGIGLLAQPPVESSQDSQKSISSRTHPGPLAATAARSEVRNAQWDAGAALKAYGGEDTQSRAVNNYAAQLLREAVASGDILRFIGIIHDFKVQARNQDVPIGVINQMLFEVTKDDEELRNKVSGYFYFLNDKKEKKSKDFTANDREAWNAIISLGIGHLMTVSPEMDEAKAGGMADVLTELYPELAEFGVSVTRVTLGYQSAQTGAKGQNGRNSKIFDLVKAKKLEHLDNSLRIRIGPLKVSGSDRISTPERDVLAEVFVGRSDQQDMETVYLYNRQVSTVLYPSNLSGAQTLELTVFLSRGALEYARMANFHPGVIITNDWMTNLIPLYLRVDPSDTSYRRDPNFRLTKTIPMLHNAGKPYQMRIFTNEVQYGEPHDNFSLLNVSGDHYDGISDPGDHTHMNLVRAALTHSDGALAVSPGYLIENLQPGSVSGLDWFLQQKAADVAGISNGLHGKWLRDFDNIGRENTDKSASSPDETLLKNYLTHLPAYKKAMKEKIQKDYSLPERRNGKTYLGSLSEDPSAVLVSMAARLADQKGVELLTDGVQQVLAKEPKAQILIAGSVPNTGEGSVEDQFRKAMEALANNPKYAGRFVFHPEFIKPQELLLASDAFLMPSKDEPGGIAQLQALLAGASVIGRKVGGIANTVRQVKVNRQGALIQSVDGDGVLFTDFSTAAFVDAALKTIRYLKDDRIRPLISLNAASADNFWETRIPYYLAFIQKITGVLDYDYPHLAQTRQLLAEIQPHLQESKPGTPDGSPARSELRNAQAGLEADDYLSITQIRREDLTAIAQLAGGIFPALLSPNAAREVLEFLDVNDSASSHSLSGATRFRNTPNVSPEQITAALAKLPKRVSAEALILDESFVLKGGLAFAPTLFSSQPIVILSSNPKVDNEVRRFNQLHHLNIPVLRTVEAAQKELSRLIGNLGGTQAGSLSSRALLGQDYDSNIRAELLRKEVQVTVVSNSTIEWMAQTAGISEFLRQLADVYTKIARSA